MTTARTLINTSLRRLGVLAQGETPTDQEAQDALSALNNMLDAWSLENLFVLAPTITTQALTASKQTYTIGSGGDIAITWPVQVDQAQLRVTTQTPNLDLPVNVLNEQQFGRIRLKTLESTYVQAVWLQTTFPLATLYVWPVPNAGGTSLVLWTQGLVGSFATLDTDVNLGRGYARAISFNLAIDLADEYGRVVTPSMAVTADDSRATLKRANTTPILATVDVPSSEAFGAYNWRSDEGA